MKIEIKIPDIAENVESGYVAGILVSEGDRVEVDQPVIEVETDKAATDIPSTHAGTVKEIRVKEGDEVRVGQTVLVLEDEEKVKGEEEKGKGEKEVKGEREPERSGARESVAGQKGKEEEEAEEPEEEEEREEEAEEPEEEEEQEEEEEREEEAEEPEEEEEQEEEEEEKPGREPERKEGRALGADIPASPSVRRRAREAGIELGNMQGSGPGGRITYGDLETREKRPPERKAEELPDFSRWGNVTREPMARVRKLTASRMSDSWTQVPHVTQFDEADITEMEAFRLKYAETVEKQGARLTITAILLKISAFALQRFPKFNASLDMDSGEIILKHYYHIGIAVDTERGLLVPVIRDVDRKPLADLSSEVHSLAGKARDKKLSPEELQGGNFSISNLGGIGGTGFTPIVYTPQVAVLGISRAQYRQIHRNDAFEKRLVLPLSLSYDHRLIDGAEGARFLRWICDFLEDPYAILK